MGIESLSSAVANCVHCTQKGLANVNAASTARLIDATPGNGLANALVTAKTMANDVTNTNLPYLLNNTSRVI